MFPAPFNLVLACLLDALFGDPQFRLHPVRLIGDVAETAKRFFFPLGRLGGLLTLFFTALVVVVAVGLSVQKVSLLEPFFLYFFIAEKALREEGLKVYQALKDGDLKRARWLLSFIVGRETRDLSPSECIRAAVETISENFSDGFVGPLFYYLLGGIKVSALYKVVETLDSMYGYKAEPYRSFGYFPAKTDDLFNFFPARLAGLFLVLAAFLFGYQGRSAFRIMRRDAPRHDSPNAGWPEAAMAGALGIELGGPLSYHGKRFEKARLGEPLRERQTEDIKRAASLLRGAAFLWILFIFVLEVVLWRFGYPHLISAIISGLKSAWTI